MYEGGYADALVDSVARLVTVGVNVIVLPALTDTGRPSYDPALSGRVAALGVPVFACTRDQFPNLMATALRREACPSLGGRPRHQVRAVGHMI